MTSQKTISEFITRWSYGGSCFGLNERQGSQQQFLELCDVIGVAHPTGVNDGVNDYLFESATLMLSQKRGYADVFKRGAFAWEYKAPGEDLEPALNQLMRYAMALGNPPLLIVSDMRLIEVHTHFTGSPSVRHVISIGDLADPAKRELLRQCFDSPDSLRPQITTRQITEDAAHTFATTAERMRAAGVAPERVSRFLTQCIFCFFAEDVGLLPKKLFEQLVSNSRISPASLESGLSSLFTTMQSGGLFGAEPISWFNGGLFAVIDVPSLTPMDIAALRNAATQDWSHVDPSIFGTLFERGLDPRKRSQLGAHYTDPATIERLTGPAIRDPLIEKWQDVKKRMSVELSKSRRNDDAAYKRGKKHFVEFLEELRNFRTLDPACGSGNFLYIALKTLKDIEHLANLEAEELGLQREVDSYTGPANVLGIELNEYAADLARLTVWLGELQWRRQHGYPFARDPILHPLNHIECRDALVDAGKEAQWPAADVIVANPPFLGDKWMRAELGDAYTETLRTIFDGRVPGGADLVTYWFEKARAEVAAGRCKRAGLVATNSIRQKRNRVVLERVANSCAITNAWSDQEWVNEGAAVRVSLLSFARKDMATQKYLDGVQVTDINTNLTSGGKGGVDLTLAQPLPENKGRSFFGLCLAGPFDVSGEQARAWLKQPNPNGKPNSDVLRPLRNGNDVLKGSKDRWVVDFGATMEDAEACQYQKPYEHVVQHVKPDRLKNNRKARADRWWRHGEARPGMRRALAEMKIFEGGGGVDVGRYIATVETAKHRVFVWLPISVAPEHRLIVFPRCDDVTFGVLSSRIHVVWALAQGGTLEDRPVYNSTRCFETFPFPAGLTPDIPAKSFIGQARASKIKDAAQNMVKLRDQWLAPDEWVETLPEIVKGYPDRVLPKPANAQDMKDRTLTALYSAKPEWLKKAHEALDAAVADAYGWADYSPDMPDIEILSRLLALNTQRTTP